MVIGFKKESFCKKKSDYYKLVILDEADSITQKAQNLLNNIIATYRKNTRFIFICNDDKDESSVSNSFFDVVTIRCICKILFACTVAG